MAFTSGNTSMAAYPSTEVLVNLNKCTIDHIHDHNVCLVQQILSTIKAQQPSIVAVIARLTKAYDKHRSSDELISFGRIFHCASFRMTLHGPKLDLPSLVEVMQMLESLCGIETDYERTGPKGRECHYRNTNGQACMEPCHNATDEWQGIMMKQRLRFCSGDLANISSFIETIGDKLVTLTQHIETMNARLDWWGTHYLFATGLRFTVHMGDCSICGGDLFAEEAGDIGYLERCGHRFHKDCLDEHLSNIVPDTGDMREWRSPSCWHGIYGVEEDLSATLRKIGYGHSCGALTTLAQDTLAILIRDA